MRRPPALGPFLILLLTCLPAVSMAVPGDLPPAARDSLVVAEELRFGVGTSYMIGMTLVEKGAYGEALPYLYHAFQHGGEEPEIATAYLEALLVMGYAHDAIVVLDRMIENAPDDPQLQRRRVSLLVESGQMVTALESLSRARDEGWFSPGLLLLEAQIEAERGDVDRALALYTVALDSAPDDRERVFLRMADLLETAGRPAELGQLWERARGAEPESEAIRFGQLRNFVLGGRIEEARAAANALDAAAADSSSLDHSIVWEMELVTLLVEFEQLDDALDILRTRFDRGLSATIQERLLLARLLARAGDGAMLRPVIDDIIARWPEDSRGHYLDGDVAAMNGDLPRARSSLERAIELTPHNGMYRVAYVRALLLEYNTGTGDGVAEEIREAVRKAAVLLEEGAGSDHMMLGYALRRLGDTEDAAVYFETASVDQRVRQDALLNLSICRELREDFRSARKVLEKARREYPDSPRVANALGYYLATRNRDLERAGQLVREALEAEPENGAYLDSLGWVYYRLGRLDEAFDYLVQAVNREPGDATILEHLGTVMVELGRKVEGLRVLRQALDAGPGTGDLPERIAALEKELGLE